VIVQALIDGPAVITGVTRQVINFKDIALTDLLADGTVDGKRVKVARNARQKSLSSAWKALKIQEKWNATSWAKGIAAKAAKASLSDLGRFKAKVAKRTTASKIRARLGK
jgi:large subunit ribosomal protein L14e